MALGSASKLPSPAEPRYLGQSASTSRPTKRLVGGSDDNVKPWKRQTREKSSRTGSEESRTLQVAQEAWNVGQSHFAEIYKPVLPKAGKQKLFFKRDRNGQVTSILGKVFSWSGNIAHMDDEEIAIETLEPYNQLARSALVERLEKVLPQLRHGNLQSLGLPGTYVRGEKEFFVHETVDIQGVGPVLRLIYKNIDVRIDKKLFAGNEINLENEEKIDAATGTRLSLKVEQVVFARDLLETKAGPGNAEGEEASLPSLLKLNFKAASVRGPN